MVTASHPDTHPALPDTAEFAAWHLYNLNVIPRYGCLGIGALTRLVQRGYGIHTCPLHSGGRALLVYPKHGNLCFTTGKIVAEAHLETPTYRVITAVGEHIRLPDGSHLILAEGCIQYISINSQRMLIRMLQGRLDLPFSVRLGVAPTEPPGS